MRLSCSLATSARARPPSSQHVRREFRTAGSAVNIATLASDRSHPRPGQRVQRVLVDLLEHAPGELRRAGGQGRFGGSDEPSLLEASVRGQSGRLDQHARP